MDLLELNGLGAFRMNYGEQALADAATDKARALLIFLALEGAQPRTSLAALLWPYLPQDAAFDNLRKTLYRLRQRLEDRIPGVSAFLVADRQIVQLDPQHIAVDVLRFQAALAQSERHAHGALAACDPCLARLADAVERYQGELLAGFGLPDAPAFEEWLLLRRETLQQQALLALAGLATAWETRGEYARALLYVSRSLALDPLREEMQRQQMRLLIALGQRSQALQQYESCRRLLRDQLGIEPDPATVALYEQIRRGELPAPPVAPPAAPVQTPSAEVTNAPAWSEVPETGRVYGREAEVAQLKRWLSVERCQLVALLGIGGVGKTTLAATIANAVAADFDQVIWRSLLNAPPLDELLRSVLRRLGQPPVAEALCSLDEQMALLRNELRRQRCLLVLDNLDSLLQPEGIGQMRAGYEGYAQLLRQLVESRHTSTLLLTSREHAHGLARWEADLPWVHSLRVAGLDSAAGQALLTARGLGSQADDGRTLVQRYAGHPFALKLVAETIQEVFGGNIGAFFSSDVVIFDDMRALLDQQVARLPALEQELLFWLAVEREPVALATLSANLVPRRSVQEVVQALRALQRRSLVQRIDPGHTSDAVVEPASKGIETRFASPNVILEHLVKCLIETACGEIEQEQLLWLHKYALMQAQAKEYVRQIQERLILQPIVSRLVDRLGREAIGSKILRTLRALRAEPLPPHGYAVGNLLNLLTLLEIDVGPLDLAGLSVWQADLRQTTLAGSNLHGADLTGSRFADAFNAIRTVAVSPDGRLVAGGSAGGEIHLWDAATGQLVQVYWGHTGVVRSLAFRPDGRVLASGSEDRTVRLWRVVGIPVAAPGVEPFVYRLAGHSGRVTSLAFHPDGKTLVSGSADSSVRLWDAERGETRAILHGHDSWVCAVAVSPDGRTLATGGHDRIIRLWDLQTAELRATLTGHTALVSALAFDPLGNQLASGSYDCSVCVWDLASGQKILAFEAATDLITTVAFSPDGSHLAAGGDDCSIRVYDMRTGKLASVFHGHTDAISSVAFSPNGQTLVSGGVDQQLCLWDMDTARIRHLFSGYSQSINSLAFHPGGGMLASGHYDRVVRLWSLDDQQVRQTLRGHTRRVNCVAFNADGTLLASGSDDTSVHVWTVPGEGNARLRTVLRGHRHDVVAVAFHPHGEILVSGSDDQTIGFWRLEEGQRQRTVRTDDRIFWSLAFDPAGKLLASASDKYIRLWDVQSGRLCTTVEGHVNYIMSLALSPDGHSLASGDSDGSIGLWQVWGSAQVRHSDTLHGHADRVFTVVFDPTGRFLASGSADHTVRLWDLEKHELVRTLTGHTHWVLTVAFSPDGSTIASGGLDGTIRLWAARSGESLGVLHTPGPYAGMNITAVKGISDAECTTLKLLGAIEQ